MAYIYEVDVPATVLVCEREKCRKRFIETVKGRKHCSASCRTMVWQDKNREHVRAASKDHQKSERQRMRELRDSINTQIRGADDGN